MKNEERRMKNEEFCCAMQVYRKDILHSSFLILHFPIGCIFLRTSLEISKNI
jgi:hypothetical protein